MNWIGGGLIPIIIYAQNVVASITPPAGDVLGTESLNVIGTESSDEIGVS